MNLLKSILIVLLVALTSVEHSAFVISASPRTVPLRKHLSASPSGDSFEERLLALEAEVLRLRSTISALQARIASSSPPSGRRTRQAVPTPTEFDLARRQLEESWAVFSAVDSEESCDLEAFFESPEDSVGCSQEKCPTCDGSGKLPCRFCGGTTFLTVGDDVFFSTNEDGGTENQKCPVCNDDGVEECRDCKGAGFMAAWRATEFQEKVAKSSNIK